MARDVAWYQKLGCDQDPFSPNPAVDRFYFETPALASHLNTLTSVASKGEFIGLVKGERGIGKTTLLNQMAKRFRDDPDVAFTRVTCTEGCSLIQSLGISSGLTEEELAVEPRKVLIEHLTRLRTGGQKVVAAIDDAHLLSPQDLAMLIRIGLSPNASGLVHTVLFAEADIEARLWLSAINDPLPLDRLYTLILTPLAAEQVQAYLSHRLAASGLDRVSFSGAEAAAIQRRSAGLPAAINEQASQRLARRYGPVLSRGLGVVQRFRPAWAIGLSGVAIAAGLVIWQRDAVTEWASSLNLSLPFGRDVTGTEVAIAIPGQPGEKPAEIAPELSKPTEMPDSSEPLTEVSSGTDLAAATASVSIEPPDMPPIAGAIRNAAGDHAPRAEALATDSVVTGAPVTSTSEVATLLPDMPESLRERLRERELERQQLSGDVLPGTVLSDGSDVAVVDEPDSVAAQPATPALDAPPPLTDFPALAALAELPGASDVQIAPATPSTPSTPITGRSERASSGEAETTTATPVRPRPRPEILAAVTDGGAPVVEPTDAPVVENEDALEEAVTVAAEPSPVTRQIPRPRPRPEMPPAQQLATSSGAESSSTPVTSAPASGGQTEQANNARPAPPQAAPSVPSSTNREDWFRQQAPGDYVIQLLVASEEGKLQSYIAARRFPASTAYYQRSQGNYVLVVGPYADQREARRAISSLPQDVQRNGPWVRSIASVQKELR